MNQPEPWVIYSGAKLTASNIIAKSANADSEETWNIVTNNSQILM
jgi:hypothetical protein